MTTRRNSEAVKPFIPNPGKILNHLINFHFFYTVDLFFVLCIYSILVSKKKENNEPINLNPLVLYYRKRVCVKVY